jgi:transaldolase
MPESTLHAFADHGKITGDTVTGTAGEARQLFDALSAAGIDVADVFVTLENEGVEKFEKSWLELLESVDGQLKAAAGS